MGGALASATAHFRLQIVHEFLAPRRRCGVYAGVTARWSRARARVGDTCRIGHDVAHRNHPAVSKRIRRAISSSDYTRASKRCRCTKRRRTPIAKLFRRRDFDGWCAVVGFSWRKCRSIGGSSVARRQKVDFRHGSEHALARVVPAWRSSCSVRFRWQRHVVAR